MKVKVLLNPYSNRWNARKRWPQAEAALKSAGVDFDLSVSEHPDQLVELAAESVNQGFTTIVIAGGDGSIDEAINGVGRDWNAQDGFPANIGILPLGSANDLAFALDLPLDLRAAAQVIARGKTKSVDLCKCNTRFFINNSGICLEPYVSTRHERIHWIKGMARYLVAALWAILDKPEWNGQLKWDGGDFEGPISLVSVGNGRRTGGFFMTPHADPFDGKLTLAFGYRATRLGLFAALPRALRAEQGSYIEMEGMHEIHCARLQIHLDKPSPAHTDGELFDEWLADFDYQIFPGVVPVLVQ
ncbi:MAG TPA: diacylglycerol kinase family protein [Anaerolineales bacterium]|nr:diacylglycerol kinase family protein [Anaerolineales bacterium]